MTKIQNFKFLVVVFSFSFLVFNFAQAAVLYLEPESANLYQGDTFIVDIRIDTEGECINTVSVDLSFSQDALETVDFSSGNSILTIWLGSPKIDQKEGLISFAGGIPGGYCGPLPGEPGKADLLGRIALRAVRETDTKPEHETEAKLEFLESSQVLLNDGLGTPAELTTKPAVFKITGVRPLQIPKNEWQEELRKDTIPPEPFEIEIHQSPEIFEGKYFIIFSTTDKQTGIDYYEILEADKRGLLRGFTRKIEWKRAESPYLLENQTLQSIIKIKAVDKAGNERIAEHIPPKKITWKDWLPWIILVLVAWGIIWRIIAKLRGTERRTDAKI